MTGRRNFWLGLAVALCAVSLAAGLLGRGGRSEDRSDEGPTLAGAPHVLVLNGTERRGLARDIGLLLTPAGCVMVGAGNAPGGPVETSLLVDRRLGEERAAELALKLGGLRVVREWDDRVPEDAVLVLGADWPRVRDALGGGPGRREAGVAN